MKIEKLPLENPFYTKKVCLHRIISKDNFFFFIYFTNTYFKHSTPTHIYRSGIEPATRFTAAIRFTTAAAVSAKFKLKCQLSSMRSTLRTSKQHVVKNEYFIHNDLELVRKSTFKKLNHKPKNIPTYEKFNIYLRNTSVFESRKSICVSNFNRIRSSGCGKNCADGPVLSCDRRTDRQTRK